MVFTNSTHSPAINHTLSITSDPIFSFSTCRNTVLTLFRFDPHNPYFRHGQGTLTLDGCLDLCGSNYEKYKLYEILNDIVTWDLPLLLLVGNMTWAPFGWLDILASAAQLLGNPIGTIANLLDKLDKASEFKRRIEESRLYPQKSLEKPELYGQQRVGRARIVQDFATVLTALDDLPAPPGKSYFTLLTAHALRDPAYTLRAVRSAASELRELRINNRIPAAFAIFFYVFSVAAAYIQTFVVFPGDEEPINNHISHTIAFRQLYYWLLPAVLLSAYAGYFPSRRSSARILMKLVEETNRRDDTIPQHSTPMSASSATLVEAERQETGARMQEPVHDILAIELRLPRPYSGGVYTWQVPDCNPLVFTGSKPPNTVRLRTRQILAVALAFLSVGISFATAFLMSWLTPTEGMGCRNLAQMGFFGGWILNYFLTKAMCSIYVKWWGGSEVDKILWIVVSIKDAVLFAGPMLAAMHGAVAGWWNSCRCWSAPFSRGYDNAYIDLFLEKKIKHLASTGLLPGLIGASISAQALCFACMYALSKVGIAVFNRNEKVLQREFVEETGLG
ncbi:hypothetical protein BDZ91DRAFT_785948 [Kalaharituber pfeilii]|nr:hypothetical protein BDZ91DRAFT_785948 [Kalaharituber pfeilii]